MDNIIENGILIKYRGNEKIVVVPDNITEIGDEAFSYCYIIEEIIVNNNVRSIGHKAFSYCFELKSLTIHDNIKTGYYIFIECLNLREFIIAGEKIRVTFEDNLIKGFFIGTGRMTDDAKMLVNFISAQKEMKEFYFNSIYNKTTKNILAFYMAVEYDNERAKAHLKENITEIVKYFIDRDNVDNITRLLLFGYVIKDNIDELIKYAIENKKTEIQVILSNYKNNNIGFSDKCFDEFILN